MMYKKQQSGFSLVETLVAVTILLIVIIGPLTITSSTARSTSFASDQVTAFFLAQEGLELVQKVRDDYFLEYVEGSRENPWTDFLDSTILQSCIGTTQGCGLEMLTDNAGMGEVKVGINCAANDGCPLYLAPPSGSGRSIYTHTNSYPASQFSRRVYVEDLGNGREVKVTSEVTWRTGTIRESQSVRLETYLLNTYAAN